MNFMHTELVHILRYNIHQVKDRTRAKLGMMIGLRLVFVLKFDSKLGLVTTRFGDEVRISD